MDYDEALEWLYARQGLGIKLGLEKMRRLLELVGNPQHSFQSIHIAGTNGKGSVTHMLAAALANAGCKVGRTTSPHLVHFTERIHLDGRDATRDEVAHALSDLRPHVEGLDEPPTFFEISIAAAFLIFQRAGIEWVVAETGLGGRLDATNVLEPRLTVITNVGLDHQAMLGEHIGDIALEKAGIMKPGVPCVTAAKGDALHIIKSVSHDVRAPMSVVGEDYTVLPDVNGMRLLSPNGDAHYEIGAAGEHQLSNAALVVAAADALRVQGLTLPPFAVQRALRDTVIPGRLERMRVPPDWGDAEVLIDGAHNEDGAHALRRYLGHIDWASFDLIVGANRDKPWKTILNQWAPLARRVWGVPVRSGRRVESEEMREAIDVSIPFAPAGSFEEALRSALDAGATRIVVAGSLFLAGEARAVILGESLEEVRGNQ